jgi:hypothetical protein
MSFLLLVPLLIFFSSSSPSSSSFGTSRIDLTHITSSPDHTSAIPGMAQDLYVDYLMLISRPCERCVKYGLPDCIDSMRKPRKTGVKRYVPSHFLSLFPSSLFSSFSSASLATVVILDILFYTLEIQDPVRRRVSELG